MNETYNALLPLMLSDTKLHVLQKYPLRYIYKEIVAIQWVEKIKRVVYPIKENSKK